jgi:hypothetical protein
MCEDLTSFEFLNVKLAEKKSLFFSKLHPYPGVYKGGILKAHDQGIISQKKVAHLTYWPIYIIGLLIHICCETLRMYDEFSFMLV